MTDCNSDPSLWLERIALKQLRSSGWALLTPDRDIVEEYIGILGSDTVGAVSILDEDGSLLGRGGIDFYSFAATSDGGISIYEIDVWIAGCDSLRRINDTRPENLFAHAIGGHISGLAPLRWPVHVCTGRYIVSTNVQYVSPSAAKGSWLVLDGITQGNLGVCTEFELWLGFELSRQSRAYEEGRKGRWVSAR